MSWIERSSWDAERRSLRLGTQSEVERRASDAGEWAEGVRSPMGGAGGRRSRLSSVVDAVDGRLRALEERAGGGARWGMEGRRMAAGGGTARA